MLKFTIAAVLAASIPAISLTQPNIFHLDNLPERLERFFYVLDLDHDDLIDIKGSSDFLFLAEAAGYADVHYAKEFSYFALSLHHTMGDLVSLDSFMEFVYDIIQYQNEDIFPYE